LHLQVRKLRVYHDRYHDREVLFFSTT
jgi:hypothetical protein